MDQLVLAFIVGAVGALSVTALIYGVAQIRRQPSLNEMERGIWIVALILFPLVTALVWFVAGPHPFGLAVDVRRLR